MKRPKARHAQMMMAWWREQPGHEITSITTHDGQTYIRLILEGESIGTFANETAAGRALIERRNAYRIRQWRRERFG